ncbi:50S ribosomal protein L10 [bacterium]|nr:50S ribosomal protein L10 [bacterium]
MRPEKKQIVESLSQQLGASPYLLLTDYGRLTVGQFGELRKRLGAVGAECHVVKNSLLQRALDAAGLPKDDAALSGMTAMIIGSNQSEITAVAKVVKKFTKETTKSTVKAGLMGQQALRPEEVSALADLPSRDALRAQLVGLFQTPATRIAVVLAAPGTQVARVLKAKAEQEPAAA